MCNFGAVRRIEPSALARFVNTALERTGSGALRFKRERNVGARDRNRTGTLAINEAADFKSAVSTYFTTRAIHVLSNQNAPSGDEALNFWRRDPESNWANRICNPGHNRFAIAPET
jgi:hypothetical protein